MFVLHGGFQTTADYMLDVGGCQGDRGLHLCVQTLVCAYVVIVSEWWGGADMLKQLRNKIYRDVQILR